MTMFSRNEKPAEQPAVRPITPETPVSTASAPVEVRRLQGLAQSMASAPSPQEAPISVISRTLKIIGKLESTEDIQIEGEIEGDVRGVCIKIGKNAKIKGAVFGEQVELAGSVEGKIEARNVVLTSTAHMSGDVVHQDIKIESGAYINGHCRSEFGKAAAKPVASIPKPAVTAAVQIP